MPCNLLLAARADANALNNRAQTPLHLAAHAGLNDAARCLAAHMHPDMLALQDVHIFTPRGAPQGNRQGNIIPL